MQKGPAVAGKERECGKDGSKTLGHAMGGPGRDRRNGTLGLMMTDLG